MYNTSIDLANRKKKDMRTIETRIFETTDTSITVVVDVDVITLTVADFAEEMDQLAWVSDMTGLSVDHPLVESVDEFLADHV